MVTDYPFPAVDGSPLISGRIVSVYTVGFLLLFSVIFLLLQLRNKKKKHGREYGLSTVLLISVATTHSVLLFGFILVTISYLSPLPKIIRTTPDFYERSYNVNEKIEVIFDRPVSRKNLVKTLSPYTPGIFVFENPVYSTHLYRKLVFYPEFYLKNDTEYTLTLEGITNLLSINHGYGYRMKFKTNNTYSVLGLQTDAFSDGNLHITNSFPGRGWIQVGADVPIKITFNKDVDRATAENNFSIYPQTAGRFTWEGKTMTFLPDHVLPFNTIFTVKISSGVRGYDNSVLPEDYLLYFATQEEIFRLNVPSIYQKYSLSCETASLRMVLLYRGIDVNEDKLLNDIGFDPNAKNGTSWGNPYVGFVGNVRGRQMVNGYGVFWDPVSRAANKYRYAKSIENLSMSELINTVQKGTPVIVWLALKNGKPVQWMTPSGDKINTVADEHAVVVIGFMGTRNNPSRIIANDPLVGEVYIKSDEFIKKWNVFKRSGVMVY